MQNAQNKILIYLDQNILGYVCDGNLRLQQHNDVIWVYSDEHFNEMRRGDPESFLSALRDIKAQQIRLDLDDQFRIKDQAHIDDYSCPFERYEKHIETVDEKPFDITPSFEFPARVFGADNFTEVQQFPKKLSDQLDELLAPYGDTYTSLKQTAEMASTDLQQQINSKLKCIPSLIDARKLLGDSQNKIGDLKGTDPISEIWGIIGSHVPGVSMEQFFCKQPLPGIVIDHSIFQGIIGCHMMLNYVGYRKDTGTKNPKNWPNISSDGHHIAYGAYCHLLISEDAKFCSKARAIYKFFDAKTIVAQFKSG